MRYLLNCLKKLFFLSIPSWKNDGIRKKILFWFKANQNYLSVSRDCMDFGSGTQAPWSGFNSSTLFILNLVSYMILVDGRKAGGTILLALSPCCRYPRKNGGFYVAHSYASPICMGQETWSGIKKSLYRLIAGPFIRFVINFNLIFVYIFLLPLSVYCTWAF